MMENPNKPYIEIASLIPFSSIIVMPTRMALIEVPLWQQVIDWLREKELTKANDKYFTELIEIELEIDRISAHNDFPFYKL